VPSRSVRTFLNHKFRMPVHLEANECLAAPPRPRGETLSVAGTTYQLGLRVPSLGCEYLRCNKRANYVDSDCGQGLLLSLTCFDELF
jgi:hypothetical protein